MDVIQAKESASSANRPRRRFFLPLVPILAMTCMGAHCPNPTPIPKPKAGSWLVFLCKASDNNSEPHPVSYYKELFDSSQHLLLADFFKEVSNGKADVSGTDVFGWFSMSTDTNTMSPANRNNTTNPNRSQTLQDCKSIGVAGLLAQGHTINPDDYVGVIGVINVSVDSGQAGQGLPANADEVVSFYEHEMLHVYGLQHSWRMEADTSADHVWDSGIDTQYNDCWDVMSFWTCTLMFNSGPHGNDGPELEVAYRNQLGWVSAGRIFSMSTQDYPPSTVTLAPLSEPNQAGYLAASISMPSLGTYTVEYHVQTGFDQGIGTPAVIVRELRGDDLTYLVTRQNGQISYGIGEMFTDLGNGLTIHVDAMATHSATITIKTHVSSAANAGDRCGDIYVGQIKQCPAPTSCEQRHTGQLVSIDLYCL